MTVTSRWRGAQEKARARQAAATGLAAAAEHLLQVSRTRVPIEEGTLERSGVASHDATSLTGAVSYDTPYAVKQHEDASLRHGSGRTSHYLENPAKQQSQAIAQIIATACRRALG